MNLVKRIIQQLIAIIILSNILYANPDTLVIGQEAPKVMLFEYGKNAYFKSKDYIDKKYLIYSFWATWCTPCMKEIPKLHELADSLDQDKFEFILINVKEKEHEVGPFIKNKGFTLPVLIDKYAVCFESFSGQTLPLTVVIDKKGIITYYHVGYKDGDEKKLSEHLKSL